MWQCLSESDLPRLWIPKRENIYLVDAIPTLGTGKLDLRGVKAKAIELASASRSERSGHGEGQCKLNWNPRSIVGPRLRFSTPNRPPAFASSKPLSAPRRGARAPILIGLALGGIMLAAGVLLFVAAHWMDLSPTERMALLVLAVGGSHLAAAFCADRFSAMAVTLHAVGTACAGRRHFSRRPNLQHAGALANRHSALGHRRASRLVAAARLAATRVLGAAQFRSGSLANGRIVVSQSMQAYPVIGVFCRLLGDLLSQRARSGAAMDRRSRRTASRSHPGSLELVGRARPTRRQTGSSSSDGSSRFCSRSAWPSPIEKLKPG